MNVNLFRNNKTQCYYFCCLFQLTCVKYGKRELRTDLANSGILCDSFVVLF